MKNTIELTTIFTNNEFTTTTMNIDNAFLLVELTHALSILKEFTASSCIQLEFVDCNFERHSCAIAYNRKTEMFDIIVVYYEKHTCKEFTKDCVNATATMIYENLKSANKRAQVVYNTVFHD